MRDASATLGDDRVEGVEHRRDAAVVGHAATGLELDPGGDAGDLPATQPDEVKGSAAVVDLHDQRGHVGPRPEGDGADGPTDVGALPVGQVADRGSALPVG